MENNDLRKNESGCLDLTAYEAIKEVQERERVRKLIGCINRVCELSDFSLEERLVLRDNRTGRVWR